MRYVGSYFWHPFTNFCLCYDGIWATPPSISFNFIYLILFIIVVLFFTSILLSLFFYLHFLASQKLPSLHLFLYSLTVWCLYPYYHCCLFLYILLLILISVYASLDYLASCCSVLCFCLSNIRFDTVYDQSICFIMASYPCLYYFSFCWSPYWPL